MVFQMLVCLVLWKRLHLLLYKLSIVQCLERWIVDTPLSGMGAILAMATSLHSVDLFYRKLVGTDQVLQPQFLSRAE
jgi:hypothetical protein